MKSNFKIENTAGVDVTSQYIPSFHVTLHIIQRDLTATAGSDEKVYDGEVLTNSTYDVQTGVNEGFADDDAMSHITINGSQLCMGECANEISEAEIIRTSDANRDVTFCYNIHYVNGTLKVKAIENAITCGASATFTLDECATTTVVTLDEPTLNATIAPGKYVLSSNLSSLNPMGVGVHDVIWTLRDACDSVIATCTQTVTVQNAPCVGVTYQGHTYDAVRIGSQCWLTENLRNTEDADGHSIANYRAVNDDPVNVDKYGYLYSWYSAVGVEEGNNAAMPTTQSDDCGGAYVQGICPDGWAVPSQVDVNNLRAAVADNASLLKDFDPQTWIDGANGSNPNSGFNARAEGHYNSALGRFEGILLYAYFWESDSEPGASEVLSAVISFYCSNAFEIISSKEDLRPVRCVRKVAH